MNIFEIIHSAILLSALIISAAIFYNTKKLKVPPIPTLPWVKQKIIKALSMNFPDKEQKLNIAELGSGWGGLAVSIKKKFPNAVVTGYELSALPYYFSKIRQIFHFQRLRFIRADIFILNLEGYDAIAMYLTPWHLEKLKPQFEKMKPGSILVANGFSIKDWTPVETLYTGVIVKIPIYIYKI